MNTKAEAGKLARRLGCALGYRRTRNGKHVDIRLPEGMKMEGTLYVDALYHECELWEDIWPGVVQELKALSLEPLGE